MDKIVNIMTNIDYTQIKVVGVIESQPNTKHGIINVVGYLDSCWNFIPLTPTEAKITFPSRGKVFAPGFQNRHKDLIGKCIFASLMMSNNDGADEYIWNRENGNPDEHGTVITNGTVSDMGKTPDEKYSFLKQQGFFEKANISYLRFGKKMYVISPNDLKQYFIKEIDFDTILKQHNNKIVTYDGNHYVLFLEDEILNSYSKPVDVMPDSLLHEWITKEFLIKNWACLDGSKSSEALVKSIIELVNSTKLHKPVVISRKERSASIIGLLHFSYLEMLDFAKNPALRDIINQSIEANCEKFIEKEKGIHSIQLAEIRKTFEQQKVKEQQEAEDQIKQIKERIELEQLNYHIENEDLIKKKKLAEEVVDLQLRKVEEYKQQIEEQEIKLQKISDAKDHLLNDFGVIKEVMSPLINGAAIKNGIVSSSVTSNETNRKIKLSFLNDESEVIKLQQTFQNRLEFYLAQNNRVTSISKKLLGYLIHYKAILLPDNRIIQSVLKATGKCYYSIQYVTPEWRSFDCVWNNGLSDIVESSINSPDIIHYYVIENINMSYLPCFMQPIVDMIIGLTECFPLSDIAFPKNLRILLTIAEEEGLPLAVQSLKYFGCLKKDDYIIDPKKENIFSSKKCEREGCINNSLLQELSFTPMIESEYSSYLSKYE